MQAACRLAEVKPQDLRHQQVLFGFPGSAAAGTATTSVGMCICCTAVCLRVQGCLAMTGERRWRLDAQPPAPAIHCAQESADIRGKFFDVAGRTRAWCIRGCEARCWHSRASRHVSRATGAPSLAALWPARPTRARRTPLSTHSMSSGCLAASRAANALSSCISVDSPDSKAR